MRGIMKWSWGSPLDVLWWMNLSRFGWKCQWNEMKCKSRPCSFLPKQLISTRTLAALQIQSKDIRCGPNVKVMLWSVRATRQLHQCLLFFHKRERRCEPLREQTHEVFVSGRELTAFDMLPCYLRRVRTRVCLMNAGPGLRPYPEVNRHPVRRWLKGPIHPAAVKQSDTALRNTRRHGSF